MGTTEVNAKYRYVQLCRSLKTWGITTFPAKLVDKKKKEKKFYLGVTRECVHFLDYETKEITNTWPLTKIRRWASSANKKTFTLDFGDYEDSYMNIQVEDADKVSSLIAGYIDILLKARKGLQ